MGVNDMHCFIMQGYMVRMYNIYMAYTFVVLPMEMVVRSAAI